MLKTFKTKCCYCGKAVTRLIRFRNEKRFFCSRRHKVLVNGYDKNRLEGYVQYHARLAEAAKSKIPSWRIEVSGD